MPTPLKNMKVSWDYEIPTIWKVTKTMFQTTNQMIFSSHYYMSLPPLAGHRLFSDSPMMESDALFTSGMSW